MTRSTTPAPLGEEELEFATFHEGYVSRYIQLADAKAGTALVVTAGTLGYFLGQDAFVAALQLHGPCIPRALAYASGALLALSAILAFATIAPRGSKSGTGLVYWNDVAARTTDRFIEDVRCAGTDKLVRERLAHAHTIAGICARKYRCLRAALGTGAVGLAAALAFRLAA